MYTIKTPKFIPMLFPFYAWRIKPMEGGVYITFDDGPTPGITDWVLDQLKKYKAKATFFCVGNQIKQNPELFKRIYYEGHSIGNHTLSHVHGWYTTREQYLSEIEETSNIIVDLLGFKPKLFRPPYGKFSPATREAILSDYQVIMWDVLTGDFDPKMTAEACVLNTISSFEPGSIIVFHDSLKCSDKLKSILPSVLSFFYNNNFSMHSIEM